MSRKQSATPSAPRTRSIVVPSSIYAGKIDDANVEETEITAQISLPAEGGWGWVVVAASFCCIFVTDGVFFSFGAFFQNMVQDLGLNETIVSLSNSIAVAVYFVAGPISSAVINRFGFRATCMTGSMVCSMALVCTYFASNFPTIVVAYGFIGGFGASLTNMSAGLVVGFYFERLRGLAMSIASVGSSFGIMILFRLNAYIVDVAGWRVIMLLHSGLCGTMYFLAMAFRPLLSLTVTTTTETDRTVTYLPNVSTVRVAPSQAKQEGQGPRPSKVARLFSTVSNVYYPTAAAVVGEMTNAPAPTVTPTGQGQPGPSAATQSKFTITAQGPQSSISRRQLQQVKSLLSKSKVNEPQQEIFNIIDEKAMKRKWWQKCCLWEEHVPEARPMYRDDAFYISKMDNLPAYQKTINETAPEERTGLEYQMAVSRAVTAAELKERRGFLTTAVKRILVTMLDPKLMSRCSFLLLCTSGFTTYLGFLVPYIFLTDRSKQEGIPHEHSNLFVCVISFANMFGRLFHGILAMKVNPVSLYLLLNVTSGVAVVAFNFSFNIYYQYAVCLLFGFHIASMSIVRSVLLVHLYGLELLTNGTGIMLLFHGLGSLISTPTTSIIKNTFGYAVSFYVAGTFLIISGLVLLPVSALNKREKLKLSPPPEPKPATPPPATPPRATPPRGPPPPATPPHPTPPRGPPPPATPPHSTPPRGPPPPATPPPATPPPATQPPATPPPSTPPPSTPPPSTAPSATPPPGTPKKPTPTAKDIKFSDEVEKK